jgi:hypothetical protein
MTRIEEIYAALLPELAENGIEDTPLHRMWALEGLRDGWKEDDEDLPHDQAIEKSFYILAATMEIMVLRMKLTMEGYSADDLNA